MSSSDRRTSPFRPNAKRMDADKMSIVQVLVVSVLLIMFIAPIITNFEPSQVISQNDNPANLTDPAQVQPIYNYNLPASNIRIEVGEISGYSGFAYIIEAESRLYFVDLINDITMDIDLPVGVKANGAYLRGYDVDRDGDTEFFLRNYVNSTFYVLMVDINDGKVSEFTMPFGYPAVQGFGDFNGYGYPDLLIQNVDNWNNFLTLDVNTNTTIGTFQSVNSAGVTVGRFTSASEDSIALIDKMETFPFTQRNITVVEGDGTQVVNNILTSPVQDLVTFNYGGGLDEIAAIQTNGYLTVYNGLTLGAIYNESVDPLGNNTRFIETGDFNVDFQDDLVVISRDQEMAYFRDGNDGSPIREVDNVFTHSSKTVAVGYMDADAIQDVALGTTVGALGIIRGSDGNYANLEYLIDIQIFSASQIIVFDANQDNRDDVFCRVFSDVFLILSDRTNPSIELLPLDPVHPTTLDDYITVEVQVNETSSLEYADIWMKPPGGSLWYQPQDEMFASSTEGLYYAIIGDLVPGDYEYYIEIQDSYLNTGEIGNATHPQVFSVSGDFVWQIDKTETDHLDKRIHQSDIGNLSDGRPAIYTIERAGGDLDLTLVKYSQGGAIYDSLTIVNPSGIGFDNFAVFTAMLDGDNIQDIIVLDYHWNVSGILRYTVFHGSNFSLMGNGTVPYSYKSFNYLGVFDDDGDGNQELFLVSDTQPYNVIKMDSDLSWTSVDLPQSGNNRYRVFGFAVASGAPSGYIGIIRGFKQIDILSTNLVYSHSLAINMSALPNMEVAGISTMYNATTGENQFVAGFTYWNASDPTGRVYIFDSSTTNVNDTPVYQTPHQPISLLHPVDVSGDESDELFLKLAGELLLTDPGSTLSPIWSVPVTGAEPLSAIITDFDGDTQDEFILFTDQDELLTQVSFTGEVEWTVRVGEVYNPLLLGNIDSIPGEEIFAYPISTVTNFTLGAIRNLDTHYVLDVTVELQVPEVEQRQQFDANVKVLNIYGENITDASVYLNIHYMTSGGPEFNTFALYYGWLTQQYWGVTDAGWPMGYANLSVSIDHEYYHQYEELFIDAVTVRSVLRVEIETPPLVIQGENMSIRVRVFNNLDQFVEDATVAVSLGGVDKIATQSGLDYVVDYPEVRLEAGIHIAEASATHPFSVITSYEAREITVRIEATSLIVNTDFPAAVRQDEVVSAWFDIVDQYGAPVQGANVHLDSGPRGFGLVESAIPGRYNFDHTVNLGLGNHTFYLRVESTSIVGDLITEVEFEVFGNLTFFVSFSPEEPIQGQPLLVSVEVYDIYGNPVPDLDVIISMMNMPPMVAMPTGQIGEYDILIPQVPLTEGYGLINVTVEAFGEFVIPSNMIAQVYIDPATPDFSQISLEVIGLGIGASFFLSLIGMVIYFRISSSMRVDDKSKEGLKKSVRNLDRLYLVIALASGIGIVSSYGMYQSGEYGLALVLTVALLGGSVLLYGLWLYRDAMSAVLVRGALSRKRMVLGLWHLVFVPVVILMILIYGVEINWFEAKIIDQSIAIGDLSIPTIMTTIFAAYLSSILVVVVNLYREVSKGLKKIVMMEDAGTPTGVVEDEKTTMVGRFSSSIRIKFLMFLVVVGATTVMSMDFLASWELGIIILLPVAFLVVIPFISSKIIQIFSRISRGKVPVAPMET